MVLCDRCHESSAYTFWINWKFCDNCFNEMPVSISRLGVYDDNLELLVNEWFEEI